MTEKKPRPYRKKKKSHSARDDLSARGLMPGEKKEIKMKFKDIRPYISNIDRVSICDKDTLSYVNYQFISDVPESYDDLYLYGIGRIESEFPANQAIDAAVKQGVDPTGSEIIYAECIEFMLSKEPRKF